MTDKHQIVTELSRKYMGVITEQKGKRLYFYAHSNPFLKGKPFEIGFLDDGEFKVTIKDEAQEGFNF